MHGLRRGSADSALLVPGDSAPRTKDERDLRGFQRRYAVPLRLGPRWPEREKYRHKVCEDSAGQHCHDYYRTCRCGRPGQLHLHGEQRRWPGQLDCHANHER
ncbi:hypothetical protein HPB48_008460 [Haemaphysalis longicornis]|uniref:Uncharacterized protein n=1 Tax=Haemaphysalis longicornis TaxID=44386 RepID=A0A9J6FDP9_HAELO|nr:hypothetical protein HPB48_008460 [Haemaphysalis longicornis]